jgi:hypothetical protein
MTTSVESGNNTFINKASDLIGEFGKSISGTFQGVSDAVANNVKDDAAKNFDESLVDLDIASKKVDALQKIKNDANNTNIDSNTTVEIKEDLKNAIDKEAEAKKELLNAETAVDEANITPRGGKRKSKRRSNKKKRTSKKKKGGKRKSNTKRR